MEKLIRLFLAWAHDHRCHRCFGEGQVALSKKVVNCPRCYGSGFMCWRCGRPMQGIVDDAGRLVDSRCSCKVNPKEQNDTYFGICPRCGANDGYLNVGADHWFICHAHRVRWCIGTNLFSSWRGQQPTEWEANWLRIHDYTEIAPDKACYGE